MICVDNLLLERICITFIIIFILTYLYACVSDRLNLPRILVLDGCGITQAGDEEEVAAFCSHVVELDLSHNQLNDWGEVRKIDCELLQNNIPVFNCETLTYKKENEVDSRLGLQNKLRLTQNTA